MTENDILLIKQAFECNDWSQISNLESKAESDKCKIALHDRKVSLYHKEESFSGFL